RRSREHPAGPPPSRSRGRRPGGAHQVPGPVDLIGADMPGSAGGRLKSRGKASGAAPADPRQVRERIRRAEALDRGYHALVGAGFALGLAIACLGAAAVLPPSGPWTFLWAVATLMAAGVAHRGWRARRLLRDLQQLAPDSRAAVLRSLSD